MENDALKALHEGFIQFQEKHGRYRHISYSTFQELCEYLVLVNAEYKRQYGGEDAAIRQG